MIKGFGYFALLVFLAFCSQVGGLSPGFAVWFISVLAVGSGAIAIACLQFPRELENGHLKSILHAHHTPMHVLTSEIEELAVVMRRDGLLAAEGLRKGLKDPLLKYLLKRVMDGFEKVHLVQSIQNQSKRHEELLQMLQAYLDRVLQMIPVVGLLCSLFMIMDFFKAPAVAGGLSSIFIPFVLSLFLQVFLQSLYQKKITDAMDEAKIYFTVVEEAITGIQDGLNADLLRDKIHFRLLQNPRWVDA